MEHQEVFNIDHQRTSIIISIIIAITICFCAVQIRGCNEADNIAIAEVSKASGVLKVETYRDKLKITNKKEK